MTRRGFFAGLGALIGAAAFKPLEVVAPKETAPEPPTLYVAPWGNDADDGLSARHAKQTWKQAFHQLGEAGGCIIMIGQMNFAPLLRPSLLTRA
jgi:hypothetical protein